MGIYVLDKAYQAPDEGLEAGLVVTPGETPGGCSLPSGPNVWPVLGVTTHQADGGQNVAVRKLGIAEVMAAGTIRRGRAVCAADGLGRVREAVCAAAVTGIEAQNNALVWTARHPGRAGNAVSVTLVVAGNNTPFSIAVAGNAVTINAATSAEGAAVTTAAAAMAAVNAHASAGLLLEAAACGTSDGTGVLAGESAVLSGGEAGDGILGIAEEDAAAEGDLISVFLTL